MADYVNISRSANFLCFKILHHPSVGKLFRLENNVDTKYLSSCKCLSVNFSFFYSKNINFKGLFFIADFTPSARKTRFLASIDCWRHPRRSSLILGTTRACLELGQSSQINESKVDKSFEISPNFEKSFVTLNGWNRYWWYKGDWFLVYLAVFENTRNNVLWNKKITEETRTWVISIHGPQTERVWGP